MDLDNPVFRRSTLGAYIDIDSIEEELAAAVAATLPSAAAARSDRSATAGRFVQQYQALPLIKVICGGTASMGGLPPLGRPLRNPWHLVQAPFRT